MISGFFSFAIYTAIEIFYLLTLKRLLLACVPQNRRLGPDEVWLTLIPIFGTYWHFVVVLRLSETLDREFAASANPSAGSNGKGIGLAACILLALLLIPIVNMLVAIPAVICWALYWYRMAKAKETVLMGSTYAFTGQANEAGPG